MISIGILMGSSLVNGEDSYEPGTAGGGGTFVKTTEEGLVYKNTFGFYLDVDDLSGSSLVLIGRDVDMRVEACQVLKVQFGEDEEETLTTEEHGEWPMVKAAGWAYVNGVDGYWFKTMAQDRGSGDYDMFHVWIYEDKPVETDGSHPEPLHHWVAHGLEGGNVWVSLPVTG